ncbi:MAG: phosphoribosylamine--glycine ligase [Coxiella sp. DG_40]|nr:MAG: phosphoribosylamine--glycine ligase [Coxiella sp. DG_40]
MIRILLVGSGAREHAIARAIKKSSRLNSLYCFASNFNPGIQQLSSSYQLGNLNNIDDIVQFAKQRNVDFAVIGPENPLALGIVDELLKSKIPSIGPTKQLAVVETSKGFTRDLLNKYQIPASPLYKKFFDLEGVTKFLQQLGDNFVVKADGLMGGKGVKVSGEHLLSHNDAILYCQQLLAKRNNFLIEEKLVGQEFSLLSFCDGEHLAHMPVVQDHKRAFDNDTGPNTGGMGSYTNANHLLPFLNIQDVQQAQEINQATINALNEEFGKPYKGILYGGFMLTKDGVKLIEYNVRFGDPEAINVLALLETDFIEICQAIIENDLNSVKINFAHQATVCKYVVPEGYPNNPLINKEVDISGINNKELLYYAVVNVEDNKLYTAGSRTLATLGVANSILEAEQIAEDIIQRITGPVFHRKDIGSAKLINKKILQINKLCSTDYKLL